MPSVAHEALRRAATPRGGQGGDEFISEKQTKSRNVKRWRVRLRGDIQGYCGAS
jgi:hypothetical protein